MAKRKHWTQTAEGRKVMAANASKRHAARAQGSTRKFGFRRSVTDFFEAEGETETSVLAKIQENPAKYQHGYQEVRWSRWA